MIHKSNILALMAREVIEKNNNQPVLGFCFSELAAVWLGYDLEPCNLSDGTGDKGIDFWYETQTGFDIFQVKSHDLTPDGNIDIAPFDGEGVEDLRRAIDFLTADDTSVPGNEQVQDLRQRWQMALSKRRLADTPEPIQVSLNLIVFGEGLRPQAKAGFDLAQQGMPIKIGEVPIEFRLRLMSIDEICSTRWRESNREWRNRRGEKQSFIELVPEGGV